MAEEFDFEREHGDLIKGEIARLLAEMQRSSPTATFAEIIDSENFRAEARAVIQRIAQRNIDDITFDRYMKRKKTRDYFNKRLDRDVPDRPKRIPSAKRNKPDVSSLAESSSKRINSIGSSSKGSPSRKPKASSKKPESSSTQKNKQKKKNNVPTPRLNSARREEIIMDLSSDEQITKEFNQPGQTSDTQVTGLGNQILADERTKRFALIYFGGEMMILQSNLLITGTLNLLMKRWL
jgi:hypothetical protein